MSGATTMKATKIKRWKDRLFAIARSPRRFDHDLDCKVVFFTDHIEGCTCGASEANDLLNQIAQAMEAGGLVDDDD